MSLQMACEMSLPHWLDDFVSAWKEPLESEEQRMHLAVTLAAENVRHHTGGPFGAIVVEEQGGRLLGVGVNLVTALELSMAHAEMVAISLAQSASGNWNLGAAGKEDAEAAGFDEGDKPRDWVESLHRRGIRTQGGILREEAAAVLARYAKRGGAIYHPG